MTFIRKIFILLIIFCANLLLAQTNRNIDSIVRLIKTETNDTLLVRHYYKLCWEYTTVNPTKAKENGLKALELSTKINYKRGIAASLNNIGNIYYYSDDYGKAIEYYFKSYKVREKIGDKRGMSDNLNNIGVLYQSKGNYTKALEYFLKSIKISEELKELSGVAAGYNNIGLIMSNLKNFPKAKDYYERAINLFEKLNNAYGKASGLNNLALLYSDFQKFDRALPLFLKSLEIYIKNSDKNGAAICYHNIAEIYRQNGDYAKERDYINKSLELRKLINDKEGIASSTNALAKVELREKNYDKALVLANESKLMSSNIGNRQSVYNNYKLIAKIYSAKGDYKSAYDNQLLYEKLKDSLLSKDALKNIADLQVKYETDKQQREIELLTKENEIKKLENSKKESEINKQKIIIYAFVLVLLLIGVFSFFLYKSIAAKQKANKKLELAYSQIEEKNKDILDSINYAKRIQKTLLTPESFLKKNLPDHFVYYLPKDIVSGDFYWMHKLHDGRLFVAVADCTGHGVPGAFMSFIGTSKLNEIIIEKRVTNPGEVLNRLRDEIIKATNPEGKEKSLDGMDINLCLFDFEKLKVEYAGANNSLVIVRDVSLQITKADKFPVGLHFGEIKPFTNHQIDLKKGDMVYAYTDGYSDQNGGPKGKKFKIKALQDLFLTCALLPAVEQKSIIESTYLQWKKEMEQVDDVCVIGIRV